MYLSRILTERNLALLKYVSQLKTVLKQQLSETNPESILELLNLSPLQNPDFEKQLQNSDFQNVRNSEKMFTGNTEEKNPGENFGATAPDGEEDPHETNLEKSSLNSENVNLERNCGGEFAATQEMQPASLSTQVREELQRNTSILLKVKFELSSVPIFRPQ